MIKTLKDIIQVNLLVKKDELFIAEGNSLPISVNRFFIVKSDANTKRGEHAHKNLTQLLICMHGTCDVICNDGENKENVLLDSPSRGLLIPPGIWAEQIYLEDHTTLLVACDAAYDETDYIRDYNEFLKFRLEGK